MKTSDAITHFGSKIAVARALGISPAAVTQWGDTVPDLRRYQLQQLMHGVTPVEIAEKDPDPKERSVA